MMLMMSSQYKEEHHYKALMHKHTQTVDAGIQKAEGKWGGEKKQDMSTGKA